MSLLFTNPLAFWGFLALPVLVGIYWLRTRHRRHPVSSLMLWLDPAESRRGGTRIDRLRTPLLFFLELLALALLVLAAAEPRLPLRERMRPLLVVLDDSFSMQAGGEQSPRNLALEALAEELRLRPRPSVRFLLAGDGTQALGETAHTTAEARDRLRDWRCRGPTSRPEEALAFAAEMGGDLPLLLVLTDRAPPEELARGRVRWWAFGRAGSNLAFVNAARTPHEDGERCLLEIANYSDAPGEATVIVESGEPPTELHRPTLRLDPRRTSRVALTLPEGTPLLRARLDDDALAYDNQVSLLPAAVVPVRTAVRVEDETLRKVLDKAIQSTRLSAPAEDRTELLFTDRTEPLEESGDAWVVQLLAEKDAVSYTGPFVLDHNHPLTEGLSLRGVYWGAGRTTRPGGYPIILAGDVPLLTDAESAAHSHRLRLRLRPDLSNLQSEPGWVVLMSNLLRWRAAERPGLPRHNFRLGEQVALTFASPRESAVVVGPEQTRQELPVRDRRLVVRPDDVGVWSVEAGEESASFAVNALSAEESDLTGCASGRWGDWLDDTSLRMEYQGIAWLLLLLVLATAAVHLVLVSRGRGRV